MCWVAHYLTKIILNPVEESTLAPTKKPTGSLELKMEMGVFENTPQKF